jgi:hypothetical protein
MIANESISISWSVLQKVIDYFDGTIKDIIAAKRVVPIIEIEKLIPNLFKDLHDIINPALIQCGKI